MDKELENIIKKIWEINTTLENLKEKIKSLEEEKFFWERELYLVSIRKNGEE